MLSLSLTADSFIFSVHFSIRSILDVVRASCSKVSRCSAMVASHLMKEDNPSHISSGMAPLIVDGIVLGMMRGY